MNPVFVMIAGDIIAVFKYETTAKIKCADYRNSGINAFYIKKFILN